MVQERADLPKEDERTHLEMEEVGKVGTEGLVTIILLDLKQVVE